MEVYLIADQSALLRDHYKGFHLNEEMIDEQTSTTNPLNVGQQTKAPLSSFFFKANLSFQE